MVSPDGVLVVDKPTGWTSHDVIARVRRLAGTRKVGHAGTLDPLATGVLVVGIGRATRLLGHLTLTDKGYEATVRLGQSTTTDDAQGDVTAARDAAHLSDAEIAQAMVAFTGDVQQVPAAVSAIKVDGQRAYARVRAGNDVALAPRPIHVSVFEIRQVRRLRALVDLDVVVRCSSGTYVRALARDLGTSLGVGGHLTSLHRTHVGPFTSARANSLDDLAAVPAGDLPVMPLDEVAPLCFATRTLDHELAEAVRNGRRVALDLEPPGPVALVTQQGEFLALYRQDGATARAVAVLAPS